MPSGQFATVLRSQVALGRIWTYPALMGIISRRVVDDIGISFCQVPTEVSQGRVRYAHFGIGVKSGMIDGMVQELDLGSEAEALVARLRGSADASGEGRVVMKNHAGGIVVEEAGSDVIVHYVVHSDPCGGIPTWASDKGIAQAVTDIFRNLRKDIDAQRKVPRSELVAVRTTWPVV
eukprot:TRINITY_DN19559_c0_g1_i2.p2 TRINITY_DN19559_c0_g1~~TRINITY_DN19559_c0_g1_i2.p2  ORF type:complete len:177 (+),score=12.72 TRINITY_DN19559_c0_g1_i2:658-1188(+)